LLAVSDRRIVLEFIAVLVHCGVAILRASTAEGPENEDGCPRVIRYQRGPHPSVLKARLVQDTGTEYRCFGRLQSLAQAMRVIAPRNKIERPYARIPDVGQSTLVAHGKRVIRIDLLVEPRTDNNASLRNAEHLRIRIDDGEALRIERAPINDGAVVDCVPLHIEKKRRTPAQRSADISTILMQNKRSLPAGVWIPRIPCVAAEIVERCAPESVCTGFGENLNTPETEFVVLR
jgi:hypothetical protein